MIYTIKNLSRGPYNETIAHSLRQLRREIAGEDPRNLRVRVQATTDHHPEHVVITKGPRGGLQIQLP